MQGTKRSHHPRSSGSGASTLQPMMRLTLSLRRDRSHTRVRLPFLGVGLGLGLLTTTGCGVDPSSLGQFSAVVSGLDSGDEASLGGASVACEPSSGCPEAAQLSDEFNAACSLSGFAAEQQTFVTTDIDTRRDGHLVLTFNADSPAENGWYQNLRGPGLFKAVSGDFIVRTSVTARSVASAEQPPTQDFNSAGLLVRDPASTTGAENWVMYDVGYQYGFVGVESKTTQNSNSVLTLTPTDNRFAGELVVCREGSTLRMFRRLTGESGFTQDNSFDRPDLPNGLEAGLIVNGWEAIPDLQAEFDYFRVELTPAAGSCSVAGLNALYPVEPPAPTPTPEPTPLPCPGAEGFSDEFEDPCSLSSWVGQNLGYATVDIAERTSGHMTLTFNTGSPNYYGWYQDFAGPYLHKSVSGNFLVTTRIDARHSSNPAQGPSAQYNSAGILARDPASVAGNENWLVYNLGYQENSLATEGKTTDNSVSVLTLLPTGGISRGELAMCRIGAQFRLFRRLEGETGWHQEHNYARPDLPDTLDVGLMANAWESPATIRAEYDYIRLQVPTQASDCSEAGLNALVP